MSGCPSRRTGRKLTYGHAGVPPRRGDTRAHGARKSNEGDERGFTIIELLLSVLILSIIIGLSTSTVRMFYAQSADVQGTFAATNQVLLASEILTEYIHDGVASCPSSTATPSDSACTATNGEYPFAAATSSSATFFVDTDDVNGTSGPAEVSVSLTGTTFTVTLAQPTSGCPLTLTTPSTTPATVCTYGTARTLVTVPNETNPTPLSYLISGGGSCNTASIPTPTTSPVDQVISIVAMCINLDAQLKGGQQAGYQSLAYMLSPAFTMNAG
jgi:prepilin-type N-terminal cleavage/methylation domain-containing protein